FRSRAVVRRSYGPAWPFARRVGSEADFDGGARAALGGVVPRASGPLPARRRPDGPGGRRDFPGLPPRVRDLRHRLAVVRDGVERHPGSHRDVGGPRSAAERERRLTGGGTTKEEGGKDGGREGGVCAAGVDEKACWLQI